MAKGRELLARFKPGDNLPVYAAGTNIAAGRFVTISGKNAKGAYVGAHTGAGGQASGVAETDAIADKTDWRGGTNLTRKGSVARVVTGAAIPFIAGGTPVKSDANGKAIPQGGTGVILGYFLGQATDTGGAATAADQVAEIDLV
jgi:hypothetical protein